jgi:hypothetical protein
MSDADHQRACRGLLSHPLAPADLSRRAVLLRKHRTYLPFYLLTGKRGGVLATGREKVVAHLPGQDLTPEAFGSGSIAGAAFQQPRREVLVEEDSRVVVGDFKYIYPASALEGWEILDTELRDAVLADLESAVPAALAELSKSADVVDPDIPLERILEKGVGAFSTTRGTLALLELEVALIYVPVMVFSFRYGRQTFTVTLDELRGSRLAGELPFRSDWAYMLAIPVVAGLGLVLGNLLAFAARVSFYEGAVSHGSTRAAVLLGLAATAILTIGLQAAWLLVRTPLVVRVTPAGPRVERAGAPPKNPFSPANALLSFLVKAALTSKRRTTWWDA